MKAPTQPLPVTLSVVIATRNRPDKVARCVASVMAAATPQLLEVIVVDQSTGIRANLDAVVGPLAARGFALHHIATPTVGVSVGRNIGLRMASGEIVVVTDDDCVVDTGWLSSILAAFSPRPELDGVCGRILPLGEGQPGLVPVAVFPSGQAAEFPRRADPSRFGSGGNFAVRRRVLLAAGGYDETLGPGTAVPAAEDTETLFRLVRSGKKLVYDPRPLVYHESWRPAGELLDLTRSYAFGSGVYLTRALVGRHDWVALFILVRRLMLGGVWLFIGGLLLGKPWHRQAAWRRIRGTAGGVWAVLTRNPAFGLGGDWLTKLPQPLVASGDKEIGV
ncbi:MAG: glycosyltransferase [Nitrospirota bacterium]|nr:glycosyltransferase [Nitrospirota bacterium]